MKNIASDHVRSAPRLLNSSSTQLYNSFSLFCSKTSSPGASTSTSESKRQVTVRHHVLLLSQGEPVRMDDALVAEEAAGIIPIKSIPVPYLATLPMASTTPALAFCPATTAHSAFSRHPQTTSPSCQHIHTLAQKPNPTFCTYRVRTTPRIVTPFRTNHGRNSM